MCDYRRMKIGRGNRQQATYVRSETGEVLQVKEAAVLDEKGQTVVDPEAPHLGPFWSRHPLLKRFFKGGNLTLTVVGAFAIPLALVAGLAAFTVLGGFISVFLLITVLQALFGGGWGGLGPRGGGARPPGRV